MRHRKQQAVLFLCTGNYYRSRFAEILFNSVAGKMGLPWRASSRGLAPGRGGNNVGPMAVSAVKALETMAPVSADLLQPQRPSSLSGVASGGCSLGRRCSGATRPALD